MRFVAGAHASAVVIVVGLAALPLPAHAEPGPGVPAFATMDRGDSHSRAGVDLGVTFLDDDAFGDDATALRFDLHGQYVAPAGYGGYALMPLSYASFDNDAVDSELAIGNLELGGLYALPAGPTTAVLRAGLTLPTGADDFDGAVANALASRPRGTDVATATPQSFWLRLGGSILARSGMLFIRGDLGVDVPLTDEVDIETPLLDLTLELDPLVRFNLGGGVIAGPAAIMAELVNLYSTGDDVDDAAGGDDDDLQHNLAITGRYVDGNIQPSLSFVFALDEAAREEISFMFMVGVQALFGR